MIVDECMANYTYRIGVHFGVRSVGFSISLGSVLVYELLCTLDGARTNSDDLVNNVVHITSDMNVI